MGGFTVWAVVFTVVIGRPGVRYNQQLLDVTLEEHEEESTSTQVTVTLRSSEATGVRAEHTSSLNKPSVALLYCTGRRR